MQRPWNFEIGVSMSGSGSQGLMVLVELPKISLFFYAVKQSIYVFFTCASDTSFLEFCTKQTTSEAEMLLRENLGSLDRNHDFIDKFLNYKEFLPSDVLDTAFELQKAHPISVEDSSHWNPNAAAVADADEGTDDVSDGQPKGRGKKKGKKGQKVSSTLLGFNVVSNRIMMGEIQSVED